jgi:hypothetical protein
LPQSPLADKMWFRYRSQLGATDKRTFRAYFFRGLTPIAIALLFIGYPPSHRLRSPIIKSF